MYLDNEKAEQVIRKYADMIYRIAFHYVKNKPDADDILQDIWLLLITKDIPDDDEHLKRWLIHSTINKCKMHHRSFWQRNTEGLENHYGALKKQEIAPDEYGIMDKIRRLHADQRNVIYLYYYEGYTIAGIAEILGKNPNTVSSLLQRARKKLKNILEEGGINHA